MGRPRTVYRGKRKYGWLITLIAFLLIFVLIAAIWLFYYLQKFIVYDKDGLSLVLPTGQEETGGETGIPDDIQIADPVDAEIVISAPDFSQMASMVDFDGEAIHAKFIAAENATAANLNYYATTISSQTTDALVVELKVESGTLSYFSTVSLAGSYGVNGVESLGESLAALKDKGVYLVAAISCLVDDAMATRNTPLALKDAYGAVLTTEEGAWLDPYNSGTREYLAALMEEIAAMGFDEVLLTNICFPEEENVQFSQAMSYAPDPVSCVSSLAMYLRETADGLGLRLSGMAEATALRAGESAGSGQDMEFFFKVFDRVYIESGSDTYLSDVSALEGALGVSGSDRIVPLLSAAPESGSYVVK